MKNLGNKYLEIRYDSEKSVMAYNFLLSCIEFSPAEYLSFIVDLIIEASRQCRPQFVFDDSRKREFIITPDLQNEIIERVVPVWMSFGLKRYAQVLPEEFVAGLSGEQLVENAQETIPGLFESKVFDNMEEAEKWLFS